jgi:steroid delta-isomerase-like uncharacterized protein
MSQENINVVRRLFDVWNNKKTGDIDQLLTSDCRHHDPSSPEMGSGPQNYKKLIALYTTAFPDVRLTIEDIVDAGNKVAVRWSCTGTHQGPLNDITPTRKKIQITGTSTFLLDDEKIAEEWVNWDALGMLQQLGVVSQSMGTARAA